MKKKSFVYYTFFGAVNSTGIENKIKHTINSVSRLGYCAKGKNYINRPSGMFKFIKDIVVGNEDIVMIRFYDIFMPFIFPFLIFRKIKGCIIILDVPTPRVIQLKELYFDNKSKPHIYIRTIFNYMCSTWILLPFDKVIQCSIESKWFSFGVKSKTIKVGNGIEINNNLPLVHQAGFLDALSIIGVATLSEWHGYDRLIKAIYTLKKKKPEFNIKFKVVGDGPAFESIKNLVQELNLQETVELTGMLTGDKLTIAFNDAHVAVSSLGLFRVGLQESSDLKTREYMARGLSVIGAGSDPDFNTDSPFRFLVPNDESIEPIVDLLLNLKNVTLPKPSEIRSFAEKNLSFDAKISKILGIDK